MNATFALLTPRGAGGVAVVAVRGDDRHRALEPWLRGVRGEAFVPAATREPRLAALWGDRGHVDSVLVVERDQVTELHLHGSEAVVAWLMARTGPWRRDPVSPAERLVRTASSEAQLALGLEQRQFAWAEFVAELAGTSGAARRVAWQAARERSVVARALAEPARLVLVGAQNAGKSTLLNRLLFRDRALASPEPGTTRDPVRETTDLGGYPYEIVDTAGEGRPMSALDVRAMELGRRERDGAWIAVVVDGAVGPGSLERELAGEAHLWIRTKADLPPVAWPSELSPSVSVSCLDPVASSSVRELVSEAIRRVRGLPAPGPVGGPAALDEDQWSQLMALDPGSA